MKRFKKRKKIKLMTKKIKKKKWRAIIDFHKVDCEYERVLILKMLILNMILVILNSNKKCINRIFIDKHLMLTNIEVVNF